MHTSEPDSRPSNFCDDPQAGFSAQPGATARNIEKSATPCESRNSITINELSQRHLNAIELMLRGCGDLMIAKHLGVDRGTIFRWRKAPLFAAELQRQRELLHEHTAERLKSMFEPALDTVHRLLCADNPKVALRAAEVLLEMSAPQAQQLEARRAEPSQINALLAALSASIGTPTRMVEILQSSESGPQKLLKGS